MSNGPARVSSVSTGVDRRPSSLPPPPGASVLRFSADRVQPTISGRTRCISDAPEPAILSVSGNSADHEALERLLDSSWTMDEVFSLAGAREALRTQRYAIVVCDSDSIGDAWRSLAGEGSSLPYASSLIVTSRLADASLWAEALNLGAWDVLAKPFDSQELGRVLSVALLHWNGTAAAAASGD